MKALVGVLLLLLAGASSSPALELGEAPPLPQHRMAVAGGGESSVAEVIGDRGTLVLFLCVHCPWVQKWSDRIAEIAQVAEQSGIGVLGVNSNDPGRVKQDGVEGMLRQIEQHRFQFPYAVDLGSQLARAYGAQRTPEAYLFDASKKLVYRGTIDDNAYSAGSVRQRFLLDAVRAVAAGETPDPQQTKALGCTMKMYDD